MSMIRLFIDTLVLENCDFRSLKVIEKSLNFVLSVCYEPCDIQMVLYIPTLENVLVLTATSFGIMIRKKTTEEKDS